MRDRLIEAINDFNEIDFLVPPNWWIEHFADHLLAEGVIVPPVELGSMHKIYYPVKGTTVVYETKVYGIGVDEDGDIVINPTEYPEKVIEMRGVGKTVFLTKEEAERALAERREG